MRDRLLRDGFLILAVVFVGLRLFSIPPWADSVDAFAYWTTRDGSMYGGALGADGAGRIGAYLYSPVFAQALTPLVALPWPVFNAVWTGFNFALLWWLLGRAALPSLLFLPISFEIVSGNVHLVCAAAIVAGMRVPALWALPILTKVTPGIGLGWFAFRREWRPLTVALAVTAGTVAISFLLDQASWRSWFALLAREAQGPRLDTPGWYVAVPLAIRAAAAVLILAWGSLTNRAWTIPIAVTLALPILWLNGLAVLVACVPLFRDGRLRRRDAVAGSAVFPRFRIPRDASG